MILDQLQEALKFKLLELESAIKASNRSLLKLPFFKPKTTNGMYIYGPVGSGKSVLMQSFFNELEIKEKLLVHFHDFMQQVHQEIFDIRKSNLHANPVDMVAKKMSTRYRVICLDELEINDITDAMIVGKLFAELIKNKVVIVTTSNCYPDQLYSDGLQRSKFLEFIELIKNKLELFQLNNHIDYRLGKIDSHQQVYFNANDPAFDQFFSKLCEGHAPTKHIIHLKGREIICNRSYKNIAKFGFDELCINSLGPADYIALCKYYRVIFISDIPKILPEQNNEITRFINLIDELYEHDILLVASFEVDLAQLYSKGRLSFPFRRTLSRLNEMKSEEYINRAKERL